jgi:hypothetical protein
MGPRSMKSRLIDACGAALFVSLSVMPARAEDTLTVTVDRAKVFDLPTTVRTLIIGNPMIADVTLLRAAGKMVVTGKGFGETNMIALDSAGNTVREMDVIVVAGSHALIVQRGMGRESYTCAPRCQPTAMLGDDKNFFGDVTAQIQQHTSNALGR